MKDRAKKIDVDLTSRTNAGEKRAQVEVRGLQARPSDEIHADLRADQHLVSRCLQGEVAAWEQLYDQCHGPLMRSIGIMLGGNTHDSHLVEEIAARVWYKLVANDGEVLSRYDPQRGARLITFMRALAKDETSRYFRSERRRRERELATFRDRPQHYQPEFGHGATSLDEFLATLTPLERGYCAARLLSSPPESDEDLPRTPSQTNGWQLTHRIHRKLLEFLKRDP